MFVRTCMHVRAFERKCVRVRGRNCVRVCTRVRVCPCDCMCVWASVCVRLRVRACACDAAMRRVGAHVFAGCNTCVCVRACVYIGPIYAYMIYHIGRSNMKINNLSDKKFEYSSKHNFAKHISAYYKPRQPCLKKGRTSPGLP